MVEGAPVVLWAIDNAGTFIFSEGRGLEALGLAPGENVGQSAFEVYADVPEVIAAMHRALRGRPFTVAVEVHGRWFETRYAPIRDEEGQQLGAVGVSTDITQRVHATQELARSREETISRLTRAVEQRSHETAGHIERMSHFCELLARRLGLNPERADLIRMAATMHDVGKIAIPDEVLLKPAPLAADERRTMERHAELGHQILRDSQAGLLELAADIALMHHERVDGMGYPRGLAGDEISLEARIAAVGDVFDALTSDRVYRRALPLDEALALMRDGRGTHFDAEILDVFLGALEEVHEIRRRFRPGVAGVPPILS